MKLAISNIAWQSEEDENVYAAMKRYGFLGLEIAPTRIYPENPYEKSAEAKQWSEKLMADFGFAVASMQSIWFGRNEKVFGTSEERKTLIDYTKKAIDFAARIGCKNLVFGCPRNRVIPEVTDPEIGVGFFRELGNYAAKNGTVIGMEANPPIYNTNYINDTGAALDLVKRVESDGFRLNLDVGTMIQNEESVRELEKNVHLINHVHISEPGLKPIEKRKLHRELADILIGENYRNFVSIEMGKTEDLSIIENVMEYVKEIFG